MVSRDLLLDFVRRLRNFLLNHLEELLFVIIQAVDVILHGIDTQPQLG
jgi:hypothetical protein